jgi:multicomponent Na+:H+ antiporter subunit F
MFGAASLAILVVMAMALARAVSGPTVYDRILAVNSFGTLTVALIAVYGFLTERPEFLDIALVYALINFIGTMAVTKYVAFSHLGGPIEGEEWEDVPGWGAGSRLLSGSAPVSRESRHPLDPWDAGLSPDSQGFPRTVSRKTYGPRGCCGWQRPPAPALSTPDREPA